MNKKIIALLCLVFSPYVLEAQPRPERATTVDPVFTEGGNTWRIRSVPSSTSSLVLISSAPENAVWESSGTRNLGITAYREREVINVSTCLALALYPHQNFSSYSSSSGVILSSDTIVGSGGVGRGIGASKQFSHQDEIWGIWSPDGTCGNKGQGAVISEQYFSEPKKR